MNYRRLTVLTLVFLLGLLAVPSMTALGQDDPLAGTTVVGLGAVDPAVAPGETLNLIQLTLEPGATIAVHHHPGPVVIAVVSGTFTTSFVNTTGTVNRAARDGAEASSEPLVPGTEYELLPGDAIAYDADTTGHYMANLGDEPLVLMASSLFETGQPGFIFEEGTPTS